MQPQHESKTKLLDATLKVVRAKGYSATRIEDVCAEAGLTKGSFFHHFKSKEDLALAAVALAAGGTIIQEAYQTHPDVSAACERNISSHAKTLEADVRAAMRDHGIRGTWTPESLALHIQAVIQGGFILAKAKGSAAVAAESLDHLRRYVELLFGSRRTRGRNRTPSKKH